MLAAGARRPVSKVEYAILVFALEHWLATAQWREGIKRNRASLAIERAPAES